MPVTLLLICNVDTDSARCAGELKRMQLRLAPAPNIAHNLFQSVVADLKGESRPD